MFQLFFHTAILKSIQEILPLDDVLSSLKEEGKKWMTKIIAFQICNSKYEINIEGTNIEKKNLFFLKWFLKVQYSDLVDAPKKMCFLQTWVPPLT